jgi:putative transposase
MDAADYPHELTFSCFHGFPFLRSELTCGWLARAVDNARDELGFELWAYVFMPNHVHMILHPGPEQCPIAKLLKAIKAPVGSRAIAYLEEFSPEWLPRISRKRGDQMERLFWQSGGGYDRAILTSSTLSRMIDYIHQNPVRKALTATAVEWRWSSASQLVLGVPGPIALDAIPREWVEG